MIRPFSASLRCRLVLPCLLFFTAFQASALDVEIEGVEDSKLEDNIRLHLNSLDVNPEVLGDPFWQDQISKTVSTAVEPFGYYNSEAVVELKDDDVILHVTLNTPLKVVNIFAEVFGDARSDEDFSKRFNSFALKKGDVLNQPIYENFKSSTFNYALSRGYFDFNWRAPRLALVREDREANILMIADSGQRYQFGDIKIVGDDKALEIIKRLQPFEKGEYYTSAKLTEFNRRLNQSSYFSRVIARPVVTEAQGKEVPVEITLVHKPRDAFNVGLGAATDTGARMRLKWERPWVNSRGHSVSSEVFLSQPEQSFTVDYRIPQGDITNDYISIEGGYQFIDYSNTNTEAETLTVAGHRYWQESDSPWQFDASLTYLRENYTQGADPAQTTQLVMPGYGVRYLNRDDSLNITKGTYFSAFYQIGRDGYGSDIDFQKAVVEAGIVRTYNRHWLMLRAEAGAIETNNFSKVPASLRFFAGGDQSVRGFAFRDISPKDDVLDPETGEINNVSIGGKYLATGSIEYAYEVVPNWRAAVFFDAGTAANTFSVSNNCDDATGSSSDDEIGDCSPGLAYGVGTGFHWKSPIGPVRVYVARGMSDYENTWRLHFILGPEL